MTVERQHKLRLELRRGVLILAVLGACKIPQYGYSLRQHLNQAGIEIDEGTLYPLIRRLADQGLLDSEWKKTDARERRYYHISNDGIEVLAQLTADWHQLNHSLLDILTLEES